MTNRDVSVIIVGAGVSGFAAAVKLIKNGFKNITILEAQARTGGRIHTVDFSEGKIDLGAQWCHGIKGNVVHELAGSESFAETSMDFSKMSFMSSDGSPTDDGACVTLMRLCEKILAELKSEDKGSVDQLLTQKFLEAVADDEFKEIDRSLCLAVLENFKKRESSYCGCEELGQMKIGGFTQFKDCEGPTWLNWRGKGYKTIFKKLLVRTSRYYRATFRISSF